MPKQQKFISTSQAIDLANIEQKVVQSEAWKFRFLVWNPAGNIPSVAHRTKRLARVEMERLKAKCPSDTFVMLKIEAVR